MRSRSPGFLPRRAVIGVLVSAAFVAGACGGGTASPSGGGDKPYAGTTLRMLMEDLSETKYIQDMLPDFEAQTGIKVQFELVPYSNMY
jgi:ABC-type glycerol-3-phosphate transport system substrate-binding protein